MRKNVVISLICLATLLSLGWGFHDYRQQAMQWRLKQAQASERRVQADKKGIGQLQGQLEQQQRATETMKKKYENTIGQLNSQLAEKNNLGAGERRNYQATIAGLKAKVGQLSTQTAANETSATSQNGKSGSKKTDKPLTSRIGRMMKDPGMRKMVQAQQKGMMEMTHGPLYDLLDLPAEKHSALEDLLLKKQTEITNIGLDMLDDSLTPEQKEEKQKLAGSMAGQIDQEIEKLLSKEDFTVYKTYEETQPERMQVQFLNQALDADKQFNETQKNDLIFAMHKARLDFKFTTGLEKQETMLDPSKISPDMVNRYMEESRQLNAQYVDLAGRIMMPDQLKSFRASLEQQLAMQDMTIKMLTGEQK